MEMKLESLAVGNESVIADFSGGKRFILKKCPFTGCNFFHVTDLEVCPTAGQSIAEEIRRQKEQREKEARAFRAEAEYKKRLKMFRYQWRGWLGVWGGIAIGAILVFSSDETTAGAAIGITLSWAAVWILWQSAINRRIEKMAREIGAEILKGGKLRPGTIGSSLKKS